MPCIERLTKGQKVFLRRYVENKGVYACPRRPVFSDEPRMRYWRGLHYPELPVPTPPPGFCGGHTGPKKRRLNLNPGYDTRVRDREGVVFTGIGQGPIPDDELECDEEPTHWGMEELD